MLLMSFQLLFYVYYQNITSLFFFKYLFEKMTIPKTEVMKCKLEKITLLLCNVSVTFLIGWIFIITTQMTMTSNFINNCLFFTKSTNVFVFTLFFFFNQYNIFECFLKKTVFLLSIFLTSSINQSTILYPWGESINPFCEKSSNSDTIYYPLHIGFCL